MAQGKMTEVMFDDTSINVNKEVKLVFSIANTLRGPYKSDKYKDVIIPMIIIRRFECALAQTKKAVTDLFDRDPTAPPQMLEKKSGYQFYNTSHYTLKELLNDSQNIASNFVSYIEGFSANVQDIIRSLEFEKEIDKMDKNNRLLGVIRKFSELDLDPNTIDGMKMGYMFEEIIRRFSENAEAGDHYTPREVIRLLSNVLLAEGCDDIYDDGKVTTVLDMACGTGGMLSTTYDFIRRLNPDADVRLFGQENNPESYAVCLADMLIKGQTAKNIRFQDTLKKDCFENQPMRLVITNPPFGLSWGGKDAGEGVEKAVRDEYKKGSRGRFGAGLPGTGDMQLLFMQYAIAKMDKRLGRAAIIENGSPLFSGNTTSGESQIRRYMIEHDLVEAIIALPTDLFYNTSIGIYAFILSWNKRKERRGKIQLINAVDLWKPLKKPLGNKRKELSRNNIRDITKIYSDFKPGEHCKILPNEEFLYKEYAVYQPLQRRGTISRESVDVLASSALFTANSNILNESEFEDLSALDPRNAKEEKKYRKYIKSKEFIDQAIKVLKENISDKVYMDYSGFEAELKSLLSDVDGYTASRLTSIAMEMSVTDKAAVIQKDRKGNVIPDKTTRDSEIVKLNQDVKKYFKTEVLPYVPYAMWFYEYDADKPESATNKEKLGAEISFTRYFYKYEPLENSDALFDRFMKLEKSVSEQVAVLEEGEAAK